MGNVYCEVACECMDLHEDEVEEKMRIIYMILQCKPLA